MRLLARPAESLIESLIALTILAISTASALTLLRQAIGGNEVVGEKLVAQNLAREGIEALRNIRDTNYLRFPANADECWDAYGANCNSHVGNNLYGLKRVLDEAEGPLFSWDLVGLGTCVGMTASSCPDSRAYLSLYNVAIDSDSTMQLYAQSSGVPATGIIVGPAVRSKVFKRIIQIRNSTADSYTAEVSVFWKVNGVSKSISTSEVIHHVF